MRDDNRDRYGEEEEDDRDDDKRQESMCEKGYASKRVSVVNVVTGRNGVGGTGRASTTVPARGPPGSQIGE